MTRLMDRFNRMLGIWRGPVVFDSGLEGIAEFRFTPYFEGALIEVSGQSFDLRTGASQTWGVGLLALDTAGHVVWRQVNSRVGFSTMHEVERDDDVLVMRAVLAGGRSMLTTLSMEGNELQVVNSWLSPDPSVPGTRTYIRLRRAGMALPEPQP